MENQEHYSKIKIIICNNLECFVVYSCSYLFILTVNYLYGSWFRSILIHGYTYVIHGTYLRYYLRNKTIVPEKPTRLCAQFVASIIVLSNIKYCLLLCCIHFFLCVVSCLLRKTRLFIFGHNILCRCKSLAIMSI